MAKIYDLDKFIEMIKKRPGMYIFRIQLDHLYTYLDAYSFNKPETIRGKQLLKFFWENFHDYVVKYFQMENKNYVQQGKNWYEEIENHSSSNDESLNLFFDIFDEFKEDFNKKY